MTPLPAPKNLDDIFAAMDMALSCAGTEDEEVRILSSVMTDDFLRKNSSPITDEDWIHMKNLAHELEQYV